MDRFELWGRKVTITAGKNLDMILGSVTSLPVKYWRPNFFFVGMPDEKTRNLTSKTFPRKFIPGKTHPVFALKPMPGNSGFKVCPCSTKPPFNRGPHQYIKCGCTLNYTHNIMDKQSYLVRKIQFPIPQNIAGKLRFFGEVPNRCLKRTHKKSKGKKNDNS